MVRVVQTEHSPLNKLDHGHLDLANAIAEVELGLIVLDDTKPNSITVQAPILTVVSGGVIQRKGQVLPSIYSSAELAIDAWLSTMRMVRMRAHRCIWWRQRPQLLCARMAPVGHDAPIIFGHVSVAEKNIHNHWFVICRVVLLT